MNKFIVGTTIVIELTINGADLTTIVQKEIRYGLQGSSSYNVIGNVLLSDNVITGNVIINDVGLYSFWFYGVLLDGTILKSNAIGVSITNEGL